MQFIIIHLRDLDWGNNGCLVLGLPSADNVYTDGEECAAFTDPEST
jgi:hypothetical protein